MAGSRGSGAVRATRLGALTACLEPMSVQACKTTAQTVPSGLPHSTGKPPLLGPWNEHANCFVS